MDHNEANVIKPLIWEEDTRYPDHEFGRAEKIFLFTIKKVVPPAIVANPVEVDRPYDLTCALPGFHPKAGLFETANGAKVQAEWMWRAWCKEAGVISIPVSG